MHGLTSPNVFRQLDNQEETPSPNPYSIKNNYKFNINIYISTCNKLEKINSSPLVFNLILHPKFVFIRLV